MLDDSGASVPPGRASSPLNTTTIKRNALKLFETSLQQIALNHTALQCISMAQCKFWSEKKHCVA